MPRLLVCVRFLSAFAISSLTISISAIAEIAQPSAAFVDSIGINTHYTNSIWTDNPFGSPKLDLSLADLGVKHIRDNTQNASGFSRISNLYQTYGIRTDLLLVSTAAAPSQIVQAVKYFPGIEAVEGINEPDGFPQYYRGLSDIPLLNDFAATRAYQIDLYTALKADPATASISVLSPALMDAGKSPALAGIPFDQISMHSYSGPYRPTYGLDQRIWQAKQISTSSYPVVSTETGYYTSVHNGWEVSETAQAKYIPRQFAEYFNRGIARTYNYELVDGAVDSSDPEANLGLLHNDLTPKPAYTALENLIHLLEDPGDSPSIRSNSMNLTITGGSTTLQHTLLQKRDGSFYLMLWDDMSSWDVPTESDISNPDSAIELDFGASFLHANIYVPNESESWVATYDNIHSLTVGVSDQMVIVELSQHSESYVPDPALGAVPMVAAAFCTRCRRKLTLGAALGTAT